MRELEIGLYSLLAGDTAVTTAVGGTHVYNTLAPQEGARPYVVFFNSGGGPENVYPGGLESLVYMVKAVADNLTTAATIDQKLRAALHGQEATLSISGYTPLRITRTNEVQMPERLQDGSVVYHVGAFYRFRFDD